MFSQIEEVDEIALVQNSSPVLVTLGARDADGVVANIGVSATLKGGVELISFSMRMVFSEVISTPSAIEQSDFRLYAFEDMSALVNAQVVSAVSIITLSTLQLIITVATDSSQTSIDLAFEDIPWRDDTVGYLLGFVNDGSASGGCYSASSSRGHPHPNGGQDDRCVGTSQILREKIVNIRIFLGGAL